MRVTLHEPQVVDQIVQCVAVLVFAPVLVLQLVMEARVAHVGGIKFWNHRILAAMLLLQAVKAIDPYTEWGVLSSLVVTICSDNVTALIVTAGAYFVVRTVSVLYKHKLLKAPRWMVHISVAFCVLTFIICDAVNVYSVVVNRKWTSGVYYAWIMLAIVAMGGSAMLAIVRLLQSLHGVTARPPSQSGFSEPQKGARGSTAATAGRLSSSYAHPQAYQSPTSGKRPLTAPYPYGLSYSTSYTTQAAPPPAKAEIDGHTFVLHADSVSSEASSDELGNDAAAARAAKTPSSSHSTSSVHADSIPSSATDDASASASSSDASRDHTRRATRASKLRPKSASEPVSPFSDKSGLLPNDQLAEDASLAAQHAHGAPAYGAFSPRDLTPSSEGSSRRVSSVAFDPPPFQPADVSSTNSALPQATDQAPQLIVTRLQRLFFALLVVCCVSIGFLAYASYLRFTNLNKPQTLAAEFELSRCVLGWIQWVFMTILLWLAWIPLDFRFRPKRTASTPTRAARSTTAGNFFS